METNDQIVVTQKEQRKVMMATSIGNFVEWYDFVIYGYLSSSLATHFFPSKDHITSMLLTFAVFGVAFLFRPLGGIIVGMIGDKIGRRNTLATLILIMALSTTAIGLMPTYQTIGIAAPIMLVLVRCIQGFSAGGEYAGAASFIIEYSPPGKRAYLASFLSVSTYSSFIFGAGIAALLAGTLSSSDFNDWGWRIPFLISAPMGIIGLYLRLRLEDTPLFRKLEQNGEVVKAPFRETLRTQRKLIFLVFGFLLSNAIGPYMLATYIPSYLREHVGMKPTTVLLTNMLAFAVLAALLPLFGKLADRYGRKVIMLFSTLSFALFSIPAFLLFRVEGLFFVIAAQIMIAIAQAASNAVAAVAITELFPTQVRYTCGAISYNLAYMLIGGTAPFISAYLVNRTGIEYSPGILLACMGVISTFFILGLPETYRSNLQTMDKSQFSRINNPL